MAAEGTKRTGNAGANGGTNIGTNAGASGTLGGSGPDSQNSALREAQNSVFQYVSQDPGLKVRNEAGNTWGNAGGFAEAALDGVGFASWSTRDGNDEALGASARPLGSRERGSETLGTGSIALKSGELKGILQALGQLGRAGDLPKGKPQVHAIE
jgi:hypothetical protein